MHPFETQDEYNAQEFKNITLRHGRVEHKIFTACTFTRCALPETALLYCKFQDCTFRHCDLSLAVLKGSSFQNTRFEDSQLIGINWMDSALAQPARFALGRPVSFVRCALNHATFLGLSLRGVTLTRCVARDVSFEEADLSQADCTFTDFSDSRFLHTNLTGADFRGAAGYAIAPTLNTLKQTKFSLPEAMNLLYGLDIVLSDPPEE